MEALVGGEDPFASVQEAVRDGGFDEVIISTLPRKTSKWLRRDLIRRVEGLGLPVAAVVPDEGMTNKKALKQMLDGAGSRRRDGRRRRRPVLATTAHSPVTAAARPPA